MDYLKISCLEEACSSIKETGGSKVLAGGTDLLVHCRHKKICPTKVIDIKGMDFLRGVKVEDGFLKIGACTTFNEIAENDIIKEKFNVLKQASEVVACYQIRNRATIGGNICNASPAADSVPALIVLGATFTYFVDGKSTEVKASEFFTGPGKSVLPENAILTEIKIPMEMGNSKGVYLRHSRRNSLDLAIVSVAALQNNNKFSIALGSVGPTIITVPEAEALLSSEGLNESSIEKASGIASKTCKPISDLRASKEFRIEMVKAYTKKALNALMEV